KLRAKSTAQRLRTVIFVFMCFFLLHLTLDTRPFSLDHLIRPREKLRRKCQANLFCRLEVNDKFKLGRLLHRQISRFGTFQNLVHVDSSAPIEVIEGFSIEHETTFIDILLLCVNSW